MSEDPMTHIALRAHILQQAQRIGGLMPLHWTDPDGTVKTVHIPAAPFLLWTLHRDIGLELPSHHIAYQWKALSPQGLKIAGDDPLHSDWMLGAQPALDVWVWYEDTDHARAFQTGVLETMLDVQSSYGGFEAVVLAGHGTYTGYAAHPKPNTPLPDHSIAILPYLSPSYLDVMMEAFSKGGMIVAERGGRAAHLAQIAQEHHIPIVLVPNALEIYPPGVPLMVNLDQGWIRSPQETGFSHP